LESEGDGCGFTPGNDERVKTFEVLGSPDLADGGAKVAKRLRVCLEPSLEGEYADERHYQPRCWSSPPLS